ncbi:MAG: aminotransferase class V-fold PLP-dependent enzyme [Candidatus Diapherotrites archaeon]|nr:aminotransferase class V-fold PLP-dependent enzyme [Candidatus Diapherotrites archaeon]
MLNVKSIRADFPVLQKREIVYFDSACTTLKPKQVLEAVSWYYENSGVCAERSTHALGAELTEKIQRARENILRYFGADNSYCLIFTKNATEAINIVANSFKFGKKKKIIISDREHNSNLVPWLVQKRRGLAITVVPSRKDLEYDIGFFERQLSKSVGLISLVHISNIDGYVLPIREIISDAHRKGIPVMIDAAQSSLHKKPNVSKLDLDFLAFSGHKMCGPSIGGLICKKELLSKISPLVYGGGAVEKSTEKKYVLKSSNSGFEAGLQDYAGIIGLDTACHYLNRIGYKNIEKYERRLDKLLTSGLLETDGLQYVGVSDIRKKVAIVNFRIKGFSSAEVAIILDELYRIAVRSGMHCAHNWYLRNRLQPSVRASLCFYNTKEEVELFLEAVSKTASMIKEKKFSQTKSSIR